MLLALKFRREIAIAFHYMAHGPNGHSEPTSLENISYQARAITGMLPPNRHYLFITELFGILII